MADPIDTKTDEDKDKAKGGGFMDTIKDNMPASMGGFGLLMMLLAVMVGGPIGMLLGALGAAGVVGGITSLFSPTVRNAAEGAVDAVTGGGAGKSDDRVKGLQTQIVQGLGTSTEKDKAVLNIDGRDYDVKVTYDKDGKVNTAQYKLAGAADDTYQSLDIPSAGLKIGENSKDGVVVDQALADKLLYAKIEAKVRKDGKAAVTETGAHSYAIGEDKYVVYTKDNKAALVELTADGFEVKDLKGNAVKDSKGNAIIVTGITREEALKDGMLAREIGNALENKAPGALSLVYNAGTDVVKDSIKITRENKVALDSSVTTGARTEALTEGKFTIDGKDATFKIEDDKLIITRNGRDLPARELKKEEFEKITSDAAGKPSNYELNTDLLTKALKQELDKDDKLIAEFSKVTKKTASGHLVHTSQGAYLLTPTKDGIEVKNLDGSGKNDITLEGKAGLQEALQHLREAGVTPTPPSRNADISTLASRGSMSFPVTGDVGTDLLTKPITPIIPKEAMSFKDVGGGASVA